MKKNDWLNDVYLIKLEADLYNSNTYLLCVRVKVDFFQTNSWSYLFLPSPPLHYRIHPLQLTMIYIFQFYHSRGNQGNERDVKWLFMYKRCFSVNFILKHIRGFGEGVLFTSFQLFKSSNLPTTDVSFKYFTIRFCNALIIPILILKCRWYFCYCVDVWK